MSRIRALVCALLLGMILCGLILIYSAMYIPAPPPVEFKIPKPPVAPAQIQKYEDCPTFPVNFWCTVRTI